MLDSVTGEVRAITDGAAVVAVGGVGLRIQMPTPDLSRLDGTVTVHTVLLVKDEEVHLYGFASPRGRELFHALTSVSGVGPRVALGILSFHGNEALERAIATADADALSLVPGVGKKTASRIVLELKDAFGAVADVASAPSGSALGEVREALKGMGFSASEIGNVMSSLPPDGDAPTLLRHALRSLGTHEKAGLN